MIRFSDSLTGGSPSRKVRNYVWFSLILLQQGAALQSRLSRPFLQAECKTRSSFWHSATYRYLAVFPPNHTRPSFYLPQCYKVQDQGLTYSKVGPTTRLTRAPFSDTVAGNDTDIAGSAAYRHAI